jgi:hypothetical protein
MPIKQSAEWISLNILNAVYLVKEWVLLNVGIQMTGVENTLIDAALKWGIGLSILVFNIVRIVKYIKDMKNK